MVVDDEPVPLQVLCEDVLQLVLAQLDPLAMSQAAACCFALHCAAYTARKCPKWILAHEHQVRLLCYSGGKYAPRRVGRPSQGDCCLMAMGSGISEVHVDGHWLASGGCNAVANVWKVDVVGPGTPHSLEHPDNVTCVALRSDANLIATGCMDGLLRLWTLDDGMLVSEFDAHEGHVFALLWLNECELLSGGFDRSLQRWDVRHGGTCLQCQSDSAATSALAFDEHGSGLVVSPRRDRAVALLSRSTLECTMLLSGHTRPVLAVAVGGSAKIASGGCGGELRVWNALTGQCLHSLDAGGPGTYALAIHGNALITGTCGEACLRVWSLRTGEVVTRLNRPTGGNGSFCTVAVDGDLLIGGDNMSQLPSVWVLG